MEVFENLEDSLEIKRRSWEASMTPNGKKSSKLVLSVSGYFSSQIFWVLVDSVYLDISKKESKLQNSIQGCNCVYLI